MEGLRAATAKIRLAGAPRAAMDGPRASTAELVSTRGPWPELVSARAPWLELAGGWTRLLLIYICRDPIAFICVYRD
jgi:hypothetical protein